MSNVLKAWSALQMRNGRARIAALGALVVVIGGGAACSGVSSLNQPAAATSAPAQTSRSAQPAALPAAQGAPVTGAQGGAVLAAVPASAPAAADAAAKTQSQQPEAVADSSGQILNRMVIRNAQLSVEVGDIEQALAQVRAVASREGGYVSASNTHFEKLNDQDRMVADLTLQVRGDALDSAMSELRALGKVTAETSGSQDVTEEYVDLDSNLRNLQASETAILKLMDRATQIQDVLSLQRELTNVRAQIERIQGRKTYLERRTDMATITVSLRLPPVAAQLGSGAWDPFAVAQRGWLASLTLLRGVAEGIIVVLAFSWWLVPFVALGVYAWLHRRRPQPTPAAAPGTTV
jgi:uncharacterized protein DUF4349